ncbi:MAG: glycosyltransferase family 4 protein [Phycisphaerae bacterium]|nr:glycosyltransferase family 4 protein [Phycisphaerae bacterium]
MNIALVTESLDGGGAERIVRQLTVRLGQCGQRVFVYCLRSADEWGPQLRRRGAIVREAHSTGRDLLLPLRIASWVWQDRIDVINAQNSAATIMSLPASKLLGVPLLQTRQGALLGQMQRYPWLADRLIRLIDRTGIVAESLRETLPTARAARDAVFLPNCVDRESVPAEQARRELAGRCGCEFDGPIILTVGTICPEKDACGMLRALAHLRQLHHRARLVWIGPVRGDDYRAEVQRVERELDLAGCVHWLGSIDNAYRLMAGADVFCLPSRTEAMPVAVIEAMSQHVPIVATEVGGIGRCDGSIPAGECLLHHEETGLLVPPGQPELLSAALHEAISDPAGGVRRAVGAFTDYRRHFSADCMVRRYTEVFESLTAARRPRSQSSGNQAPAVLMVGPAAPAVGGMVSVIDTLTSGVLARSCRLTRFRIPLAQHAPAPSWRRVARLGRSICRHVASLWQLAMTIERRHVDIVHIHTCSYHSWYRDLANMLVARLMARRIVVHIHGAEFDQFCQKAGWLGRRLIRRGAEMADALVVLSDWWRERLTPFVGQARVVVVPNGVTPPEVLDTRPRRRRPRPCRFLFLSVLDERKGVGDLIAATQRIDAAIEVVLAGPVPAALRPRWEQAIRESGLADRIRFAGPVFDAAKWRMLQEADCFVLPSHAEGLPMVLLEAAAVGLPIISTTVGSIPEAFSVDGEPLTPLVAPRAPHELARAMRTLATDAGLRRGIGARLKHHVLTNYSAQRQGNRLLGLYRRLLGMKDTAGESVMATAMTDRVSPLASSPRRPADARAGNRGMSETT